MAVAYQTLVRVDFGQGRVVESLSFKAGGEAPNGTSPTVLSCGGIYIPQAKVPTSLKKWRQIVNLPGPDLSAKIFGEVLALNPLRPILRKEVLS